MVSRKMSKHARISFKAFDLQSKFVDEFGIDRAELIEAMTYALVGGASIRPGLTTETRWWGFQMQKGTGFLPYPQHFCASSLRDLAHVLSAESCGCVEL